MEDQMLQDFARKGAKIGMVAHSGGQQHIFRLLSKMMDVEQGMGMYPTLLVLQQTIKQRQIPVAPVELLSKLDCFVIRTGESVANVSVVNSEIEKYINEPEFGNTGVLIEFTDNGMYDATGEWDNVLPNEQQLIFLKNFDYIIQVNVNYEATITKGLRVKGV